MKLRCFGAGVAGVLVVAVLSPNAAAAASPGLPGLAVSAALPVPADATRLAPADVRGMIADALRRADNAGRWHRREGIPKRWRLTSVRTYEADGAADGFEPVGLPGQVTNWVVQVALQWTPGPLDVIDHTVTFTYRKGRLIRTAYFNHPVLEDLQFTVPKRNFAWAWRIMKQYQLQRSPWKSFQKPDAFNVRNPLGRFTTKYPWYIFAVPNRGFVFVHDRDGRVKLVDE